LCRDACRDLGLFAFKPDVAAALGLLALEDYVAFDRYLEAGAGLEWDRGEECSPRYGFGVDG